MTKKVVKNNKKDNVLIKTVEKQYGVSLGYITDKELYKSLNKKGLPSLSKLLKLTVQEV
jgi:hypothetical protein